MSFVLFLALLLLVSGIVLVGKWRNSDKKNKRAKIMIGVLLVFVLVAICYLGRVVWASINEGGQSFGG
jgi:glucose uptake protein GlcU